MNKLLDIILPRFIEEKVLFDYDEVIEAYLPVCSVNDLKPGEYFPMIGTIKSFNFFGIGLFPKLVGKLEKFKK
ncbi:hypothetical protein REA38_11605 [Serratia sp. MF2]|uniref:hypothetical protein n=1 Tax=Serratia sp. MF1(2023) TaxID=3059171 RepID=UPI0027FDE73C|nr:hypothetical protein [Serratia sp. MF1(2023)]MDQ7104195.1 hypothetical protein [Serratia sp. MF1(2023)]